MITKILRKVVNRTRRWKENTLLATEEFTENTRRLTRQFFLVSKERWWAYRHPRLVTVIQDVKEHKPVGSDDVLPFISREALSERLEFSLRLADAYIAAGDYAQAKVFVQRIWEFSRMDEQYLDLFIKVHAACDDVEAIRAAHKALGMKKARAGQIGPALRHFDDWQYSYAIHRKEDDYRYDFEILDRITQMAEPYAYPLRSPQAATGRKIRLAYLVFGMTHANSVIVKIAELYAKYHDASKFEIMFFVPDQETLVLQRPEAVAHIAAFKEHGWDVALAPDAEATEDGLLGLANAIHAWQPDILVTTAGLADFNHYFVTSLRPAPLVIGLCQGPPPQFIGPDFDWSISWFKLLQIECPVDCTFVPLRLDLPLRRYVREEAKADLKIAPERQVIMVSGRPFKLQDADFLQALVDIVASHPDAHLIVVGINELPEQIVRNASDEVMGRVSVIGWTHEFHKILNAADVVVDTYPSGGGVVIKDAMALGAPVVSFKNDYMKQFNQKECSAAEEVIGMPELLIERGDFAAMQGVVSRLLTDHAYRIDLSQRCIERITETSGRPEKMVRDCEAIYRRVLNTKHDKSKAQA